MMNCRTNRYKKEISNVIHNYCNFAHTMVARIFRTECILWLSALGQYCSHFARYCLHSRYFESVGNRIDLSLLKIREAARWVASPHKLKAGNIQSAEYMWNHV